MSMRSKKRFSFERSTEEKSTWSAWALPRPSMCWEMRWPWARIRSTSSQTGRLQERTPWRRRIPLPRPLRRSWGTWTWWFAESRPSTGIRLKSDRALPPAWESRNSLMFQRLKRLTPPRRGWWLNECWSTEKRLSKLRFPRWLRWLKESMNPDFLPF
jgi:hypothetical protein